MKNRKSGYPRSAIALLSLVAAGNAFASGATDPKALRVLESPMIRAIQKGLRQEQGLRCAVTRDENNDLTVQFVEEDGLRKFVALLLCKDGRSAQFKGVLGDGGQTRVEEFSLVRAQ